MGTFRDIPIKLTEKGVQLGKLLFDAYSTSKDGLNTILVPIDHAKPLCKDNLLTRTPKPDKYKLTMLGSTLYSIVTLMLDMTGSSDLYSEFNWSSFKGQLVLCIGEGAERYRFYYIRVLKDRGYLTYGAYVEQFKRRPIEPPR